MISLSSLIYEVTIYSSSSFLDRLKDLNIKVLSLKSIDKYKYLIEIPYKYKNIFENNFKSIKLVNIKGLFKVLNMLLINKYTLISFIVSLIFFFYFSTRLIVIDIKGNSLLMNEKIENYLAINNIKKYTKIPSINELKEYKNEFFFENIDTLKNIEFYTSGNRLIITYSLKDKEVILDELEGKMYSKCDAIISKIEISSGNVLVKENMFVKKGDILVDDYLYYKDEPIFIGTKGKIYGYTFNLIEVKSIYYDSEVETFTTLINSSRNKNYISFAEGDRIDKEEILSFKYDEKNNYSYLKVLYTNYINIVTY